jgi:8-oxo-dGTP pyrophosphatase MutT (NUDIX family)
MLWKAWVRRKRMMAAVSDSHVLRQFGALPFLVNEQGEISVLLVTTRGRREWIIPKGWPMRDLSAAAAAAREAYEEAGLIGSVVGAEAFGSYRYEKQRNSRKSMPCEVIVFLFAVERQLRKWPEKSQRETRWFPLEEASLAVAAAGLAELLSNASPKSFIEQLAAAAH